MATSKRERKTSGFQKDPWPLLLGSRNSLTSYTMRKTAATTVANVLLGKYVNGLGEHWRRDHTGSGRLKVRVYFHK